ncbi:ribonuclease H-like domain-containing protein [Mycena sp. CBHHK59/15]|nr:ribonuclease H-like domain-containing protein [Mycena sp. CBHHK59/15]
MPNSLQDHFWKGEKQNTTYYKNYCKACVKNQMKSVGAPLADIVMQGQAFKDACTAVGSVLSKKDSWIAHLIGGKTASAEAKADATAQRIASKKRAEPDTAGGTEPPHKKQQQDATPIQSTLTGFRRNEMPYGEAEKAAIESHALRAIVSGGLPLGAFEDHEMRLLIGMFRTTAPAILPTGKVAGGRLLKAAAADVEAITIKVLKGTTAGLSTDGWKCKKKNAINAICANSYLIELVEVTALNKDGPALCEQFAAMIDRVEVKYGCIIIYFTTDADGGSKKGRQLLGIKHPWLILPSCWAHQFQLILGDYFKVNDMAAVIAEDATAIISWINNHGKVRKIFDEAQKTISLDRLGKIIILAYLVANITRWTTHFIAFCRLFLLRAALQLAVLQNQSAIIAAEVGTATSTEGVHLREDAERFCTLIEDSLFWSGLETILGDLEPICLGMNINQKDSTRLDQPEVKKAMLICLEKRWADCDQPAFLAALILNPFEKLSCFGPNANLNQFKCLSLLISLYRRMADRPDNSDSPDQRKLKEGEVSKAIIQYLSGTGDFNDFDAEAWKEMMASLFIIVSRSKHLAELAEFAILIHYIVANQAGCERTFSRTKIEQSDHRNRLGLEKIDMRTKVKGQIRSDHQRDGIYKPRKPRKNHKSTANLLAVPRYRDLLDDQDDEDPSERGRALVSSREGWRTQTAKWISDTRAADRDAEDPDSDEEADTTLTFRLACLLGKNNAPHLIRRRRESSARKPSARVIQEEELLMQALAEELEDDVPDDGAIEIDSEDEYRA